MKAQSRRGFLATLVAVASVPVATSIGLLAISPISFAKSVVGDTRASKTYVCVVQTLQGDHVASLIFKTSDGDQIVSVSGKALFAVRLKPTEDRWLKLQIFDLDSNGRPSNELESMIIGDHTVAKFPSIGMSFNVFSTPG